MFCYGILAHVENAVISGTTGSSSHFIVKKIIKNGSQDVIPPGIKSVKYNYSSQGKSPAHIVHDFVGNNNGLSTSLNHLSQASSTTNEVAKRNDISLISSRASNWTYTCTNGVCKNETWSSSPDGIIPTLYHGTVEKIFHGHGSHSASSTSSKFRGTCVNGVCKNEPRTLSPNGVDQESSHFRIKKLLQRQSIRDPSSRSNWTYTCNNGICKNEKWSSSPDGLIKVLSHSIVDKLAESHGIGAASYSSSKFRLNCVNGLCNNKTWGSLQNGVGQDSSQSSVPTFMKGQGILSSYHNSTRYRNNCTAGICEGIVWNSWPSGFGKPSGGFRKLNALASSKRKYRSKTRGIVKRNNFLLIFKRK